jgi:AraC family transcriptional regulator, regulatory protein of adaptative response / DNA-3-methyladenine glycosylase II
MVLNDDSAYLAILARDARFDGRLFVGVTSTGVYCRPVCRVRPPMRKNCVFFDTRAQAEAAAFRPCMKCRPEIAPGLSHTDSSRSLADTAARMVEHAVHSGQATSITLMANKLGITDRHLRRIFVATHGVGPHGYLNTQRLLLAKHLLTDTPLPITQVALASGFVSLRRFNAAFLQHYRFNPTQLRREGAAPHVMSNVNSIVKTSTKTSIKTSIRSAINPSATARTASASPAKSALRLAYRPPYDVAGVMAFFKHRELQGVEAVDAGPALTLRRTLGWLHAGKAVAGWIECRFVPQKNEVHVNASDSLSPVLGAVMQRVRQGLDLDADPSMIDPTMALLPLPLRPGTRVPGGMDGFEVAVRVILGQQVTVKAARTLTQRLVNQFGQPINTPFAALTHVFPNADTIANASAEVIGKLGIVRQRVGALQAIAQAVVEGTIELNRSAPVQPTMDALRALPGIGDWTAQVIAMRALAWPDAWPASDIALMNTLGSRNIKHINAVAEPWRPWRAYAVMRLWHSVENPE